MAKLSHLSNRKHLTLLLLLGLVLVPAIGITPVVLIPWSVPPGPGASKTTLLIFAGVFVIGGLAIIAYAVRAVPARLELTDTLKVQYLFRTRAFRPDQVADVFVKDRSVTLETHAGLPLTAKDTILTIGFLDGSSLSLSVPASAATEFQTVVESWLERSMTGPVDLSTLRQAVEECWNDYQREADPHVNPETWEQDELRLDAVMALIEANEERPEVVPTLLQALTDSYVYVRRHAARGLGQYDAATSEVTDALVRALRDSDERVRMLAAESLVTRGEALPAAVPILLEALQSLWDGDVHSEAAAYLAICGPGAVEALPFVVQALQDADARVRLHAAEAIWRIGRQAEPAVDVLVRLLEGHEGFVTNFLDDGMGGFHCCPRASFADYDPVIQAAAARILGEMGSPAKGAVPALTAALDEADPVGREAAAALRKINSE
jgi:HEAT repeat protein